jgi:hypothetical protein
MRSPADTPAALAHVRSNISEFVAGAAIPGFT